MTISDNAPSYNPRLFSHWIAAGLGSGFLPKAPGTWGSLAALLPAWLILQTAGVTGLLIASLLVSILGCWNCAIVLPRLPTNDPGWIVIDEWAGQWLCLALLLPFFDSLTLTFLIAFVVFRLFDIFKPWPVSRAEKLGPAWWSIMADDIVAGLMGAGLVIAGLQALSFIA
ncbi:MAG: phosphatidylglycerophosphatase A [Mariprofundus sp.]|nr:phosphatidylglycerophosphatase A [Mariprofundus sp.]